MKTNNNQTNTSMYITVAIRIHIKMHVTTVYVEFDAIQSIKKNKKNKINLKPDQTHPKVWLCTPHHTRRMSRFIPAVRGESDGGRGGAGRGQRPPPPPQRHPPRLRRGDGMASTLSSPCHHHRSSYYSHQLRRRCLRLRPSTAASGRPSGSSIARPSILIPCIFHSWFWGERLDYRSYLIHFMCVPQDLH